MVVGIWFAPAAMLPLSLVMLVGLRLANAAIVRVGMGRGRIRLAAVLALPPRLTNGSHQGHTTDHCVRHLPVRLEIDLDGSVW